MFFFFYDEDAPEGAPMVYRVDELADCKHALDNLKELKDRYEQMGMEKQEEDEESESIAEAIQEQEKQIHNFSSKYVYDNTRLRDNLNQLLKQNGLQVNTLEALLELSAGYISRTMGKDAKKRLSIDVVCKIASMFNINMNDLLNTDLSAPTKDMKKVVDFIGKLKKDIEDEKSHWTTITLFPFREKGDSDLFFSKDGKKEIYKPVDKGSFIGKASELFKLDTKVGILFFVKGRSCFDDADVYEIYQFDEEDYMSRMGSGYESEYPLTLLAETFMERSGVLFEKCDELYKTIKTHERDFTISNTARNIIDRFLDSGEGFMDIPEDLPFK